jgi:hypothetical protein
MIKGQQFNFQFPVFFNSLEHKKFNFFFVDVVSWLKREVLNWGKIHQVIPTSASK